MEVVYVYMYICMALSLIPFPHLVSLLLCTFGICTARMTAFLLHLLLPLYYTHYCLFTDTFPSSFFRSLMHASFFLAFFFVSLSPFFSVSLSSLSSLMYVSSFLAPFLFFVSLSSLSFLTYATSFLALSSLSSPCSLHSLFSHVYMYMYICIYAYMSYVYVYTGQTLLVCNIYVYLCIYAHMYICIYAYVYTGKKLLVRDVYMYTCVYVYTYTCIYACMYIFIYAYLHMYIQAKSC